MTINEVKRVTVQSSQEHHAAYLKTGLSAVEAVMRGAVGSSVTVLKDASEHILESGGKRVRPRLLLLAYALCGGSSIDYAAPVAAAVELMHTASVVHDDINDHGIMRRGRPSINSVWGRTFALLTGDFLFTKVYELMAPYKDMNIVLAQAASALVEGETLQATAVKENTFTREVYGRIIALKTAALFKAAGVLGAQLADAPDSAVEALGTYAFNVGLAFQIIDDILDIVGDQSKLGKTSGIDLAQGRGIAATYLNNGTNGEAKPSKNEDVMDAIKRKLLSGNALDEANQQAHQLIQAAIISLDALPDSPAKHGLIELAQQVIDRDR